jgi:hypothetical protein
VEVAGTLAEVTDKVLSITTEYLRSIKVETESH